MSPRSAYPAAPWMLGLALFIAALAPATLMAEEPPPDWTVDNVRWTRAVDAGTAIEIDNPWGDVRLRLGEELEIQASAMIQRRTADPVRGALEAERRGGTLHVAVRYPQQPKLDLHRADLTVFVPANARVTVRTRDGMIQARGLQNDLQLTSVNGNVTADTTGTARISTEGGDIALTLGGGRWDRSPRLTTARGDVSLQLPAEADVKLHIRASNLELPAKAELVRQRRDDSVVRIGQGAHDLEVDAPRGGVKVQLAGQS